MFESIKKLYKWTVFAPVPDPNFPSWLEQTQKEGLTVLWQKAEELISRLRNKQHDVFNVIFGSVLSVGSCTHLYTQSAAQQVCMQRLFFFETLGCTGKTFITWVLQQNINSIRVKTITVISSAVQLRALKTAEQRIVISRFQFQSMLRANVLST